MKTIKNILLVAIMGLFVADVGITAEEQATVSRPDLTGTFRGITHYTSPNRKMAGKRCRRNCGITKRASRIYFDPVPGEQGNYHVVFLEYTNLWGMLIPYAAPKLDKWGGEDSRWLTNKSGYLNEITTKIWVFKATPVNGKANSYALNDVRVKDGQIVPVETEPTKFLDLSEQDEHRYPLEGATTRGFQGKTMFPQQNWLPKGSTQHGLTTIVYSWIGLDSTWRKCFLPGPYLAAYEKPDDVVLNLGTEGDTMTANFFESEIGKAFAAAHSPEERAAIFTHPDSAGLEGNFEVTEPVNGMFLFQDGTVNVVGNRIGLFIDVFDATEALGQDVVELALVNPEDPTDIMMYYEDPENGAPSCEN